ncbi:MAG: AraC family transcriptional regulator [Bacteroidales bacterium]|nr:AraC family transcriptional regulator [Bacteroidales bacterium]
MMELDSNLSNTQKAKLNLVRSKIQVLNEIIAVPRPPIGMSTDTTGRLGTLLQEAQIMIVQSRPDEGIPLLMKYLEDTGNPGDSVIYARIYLAEAYRQKQEYAKGIGIINSILKSRDISVGNRAFAMNRLAALYNEMPPVIDGKQDSVVKYSRLCIAVSEKYNLTEYLAASQNELGCVYKNNGILDTAFILISEAANNFLLLKKYPQAINTYINLARVYYFMGMKEKSKDILLKALEMGSIEKNRNLFLYIYGFLSDLYSELGDYKSALEYANTASDLLNQFYHDRIQRQINEMSAKYDLQEKEARIREEEHKSKTYRIQKNYLILIALILTVLMMILVVLVRFKSRAYNKLVAQNLKAIKLERQVEQCLINLSENDIKAQTGPDGQHNELALRFEKFLAEEKPYLWSEVSLEEFCKKLNTNRTYLSNLINERYMMGFYDLIFEYRIRAAIEYLNNPEFRHLSVEGIGEMTGFKSNSNFHKRFKNLVGMTPNQFRERALKTGPHSRA